MSNSNAGASNPLPRLEPFSHVTDGVAYVKRGDGDILVENAPYGRIFHSAIVNTDGSFLYDLPTIAEPVGAIALPVDNHMRVAMIRHWRPVPARVPASDNDNAIGLPSSVASVQRGFWSLELPRGFPNHDEKPIKAACRETEEELGLCVMNAISLGSCNFNTSILLSDIPLFAVFVRTNKLSTAKRDVAERIAEVQWYCVDEVLAIVSRGEIRCGLTMAALLHLVASKDKILQFVHCYAER